MKVLAYHLNNLKKKDVLLLSACYDVIFVRNKCSGHSLSYTLTESNGHYLVKLYLTVGTTYVLFYVSATKVEQLRVFPVQFFCYSFRHGSLK